MSQKRCWRTNEPLLGRPPLAQRTTTAFIPAGIEITEVQIPAGSFDEVRVSRSDNEGTIHALEFRTVRLSDLVAPRVTEVSK